VPTALVIAQNGSQLLGHPDFLGAIGAIGIENLFTNGNKLQPNSHTLFSAADLVLRHRRIELECVPLYSKLVLAFDGSDGLFKPPFADVAPEADHVGDHSIASLAATSTLTKVLGLHRVTVGLTPAFSSGAVVCNFLVKARENRNDYEF
jgi:hypothetical protein